MAKEKRVRGARWMTAALTTTVVALAAPEIAHGWANSYCGVLIHVNSWCGDGSNHSYDTNRGTYEGGGTVLVCQRLLKADTTTVRTGSSCSYGYVFQNYGLTSTLWEAEVTQSNSNGARHTIYGYAVA